MPRVYIINGGTGEVDTEMALYYLVDIDKAKKNLKSAKYKEFQETMDVFISRCVGGKVWEKTLKML